MSGIYIHIPFCKQACHYCDFHFSTSLKKKAAMVAAIITELGLRKQELGAAVETIYFGGGTPSLLTKKELAQILEAVYAHYPVVAKPEITLEANPDDLLAKTGPVETRFREYLALGINRLSIGVQSFFEEDLRLMNRAHNAQEAAQSIALAKQYFNNITMDLIYGIPAMADSRWQQNISKALALGVPHISAYALTVEPKTALAHQIKKGTVQPIDEAQAERQFKILVAALEAAGFVHYEISNFGQPDYFSKNNTAYWLGKPYLGIGPSAHSFNGTMRSWNTSNNTKYIKAIAQGILPKEEELLSKRDRYNEYVMTGLRTIWGVSAKKILEDFGPMYEKFLRLQAKSHVENHLLFWDADTLLVTKKGKFLADGIASDLFMLNLE